MIHAKKIMKNFTAAFLSCTLAVGGCASAGSLQTLAAQENAENEDTDSDELLKDNYYEYVNHDLLETTEPEWSWLSDLDYQTNVTLYDILHEIIENRDQYEEGSDEQKIADFYFSIIDTDTRDTYGLGSFQEYIDAIYQAETIDEYIHAVGTLSHEVGYINILVFDINAYNNSSEYIPELYEMDLGFGKDFFQDEYYEDLFPEYEAYMALALREAGYGDEAESYASDVFSFMKEMSAYSTGMLFEDNYSDDSYRDQCSMEELKELYSNIDMESYLSLTGMDQSDLYSVYNIEMHKAVNDALTEENLETLKAYSIFCLMNDLSDFLSTDLSQAGIALMDKIYGIDEAEPIEEIAEELTLAWFPYEFAELYLEREFDAETKDAVTDMAYTIMDAYRDRIAQLEWMTDDTKDTAMQKLDNIGIEIAYPSEIPQIYEDVEIGSEAVENALALVSAGHIYQLSHDLGERDKDDWLYIMPTDVYGGVDDALNNLYLSAALLQTPYYDPDASDAQNYGSTGVLIARYIALLLDLSGDTYDENEDISSLQSDTDLENYEDLTQKVADYYDTFSVDGMQVNGEQTVEWDIADLAAISIVASLFEDDTEQLKDVFTSYANSMAVDYSEDMLQYQIESFPTAPEQVRVNAALMTLDSFYDVYPEIQEGDAMYLAPEDRVKVW